MQAEVIAGRFRKAEGEHTGNPYVLPQAARLGLALLDNAHESMLGRLNAAHRALNAGDEGNARLLIEGLQTDMATHFDIEEQIMLALGFRAMRDHVRYHATSAAQIDGIYRASLARGKLQISDIDLCFQAVIDEILRSDIELKSHFPGNDDGPNRTNVRHRWNL